MGVDFKQMTLKRAHLQSKEFDVDQKVDTSHMKRMSDMKSMTSLPYIIQFYEVVLTIPISQYQTKIYSSKNHNLTSF